MPATLKKFTIYLLIAAWIAGCAGGAVEVVSEEEERHYKRGKRLLREGRNQEALGAFLKVIEKRTDAAESHLESGRLFLSHVKDPIMAIYHFRRYLDLKPDSDQARFVRQLVETAQKDFISRYPGPPIDEVDRLDLLELIEQLKAENLELKRDLIAMQREAGGATEDTVAAASETSPDPAESARPGEEESSEPNDVETRPASYIVESGDTLTSISTKVYGSPGRWMDIFQANRDTLPDPNALTIGQELRIP